MRRGSLSAGFTLFSLSAVWWTQAKFCVYGHITAESSKIESPVPTLGCNLEMYGQSLYFNKTVLYDYLTFKKSLWKRFLFYFTSAVDSQPISWLSVWGIAYFLVGSSRALWKALMKSAATERSATDRWRFKSDSCDVAASCSGCFLFACDQRNSRPWTHSFLQSLRLASLPWVCPAGYALRRQKTWTHIVRKE